MRKLIALVLLLAFVLSAVPVSARQSDLSDLWTIGPAGNETYLTSGLNFVWTPDNGTDLFNLRTGNLQVGNGTPTVTLNGEDAYIEGTFEVDGAARFDGAITLTSTLTVADDQWLSLGTDADVGLKYGTTPDPDALYIGLNASRFLIIGDRADADTAESFAATGTDPTVYVANAAYNAASALTASRLTFGNTEYLDNAVNNTLEIGAATTSLTGALTVTGAATLNSSVTLGDGTGDAITFIGRVPDASTLVFGADGDATVSWNNTDVRLEITVAALRLSGDLTIAGNDLTFGNGEVIDNTTNDVLRMAMSSAGYVYIPTGNLRLSQGTPDQTQDGGDLFADTVEAQNVYVDGALMNSSNNNVITFNDANAFTRWTGSSATTAFRFVTGYVAVGNHASATQTLSGPDLFAEQLLEVGGISYLIGGAVSDAPFASSTAAANLIDLYNAGANLAIETASGNDILLSPGAATDLVLVDAGSVMVGVGTPNNSLAGGGAQFILNGLEVDGATRLDGALTANANVTIGADLLVTGAASAVRLNNGLPLYLGTSETAALLWSQTQPAALIGLDAAGARYLLICDLGDEDADLGVANQGQPTVVISNAAGNAFTYLTSGADSIFNGDIDASGGFRQALTFLEQDVGSGWTDAAADVAGSASGVNTVYVAERAGSIVGIAVANSDVVNTGTCTFEVAVNGAETGFTAVLDSTGTTQYPYATQAKGTDTFAAGDRISVTITSTAAYEESDDAVISVIVEK